MKKFYLPVFAVVSLTAAIQLYAPPAGGSSGEYYRAPMLYGSAVYSALGASDSSNASGMVTLQSAGYPSYAPPSAAVVPNLASAEITALEQEVQQLKLQMQQLIVALQQLQLWKQ